MTDDDVLATVTRLLDALAARDRETVTGLLLPDGWAVQLRDGVLTRTPLAGLPDRVEAIAGTFAEPVHDVVVHRDHDIAVVWAPYDALIDGHLHHCGTNIISLVHQDGRWLVASLTDNGRRPERTGQ